MMKSILLLGAATAALAIAAPANAAEARLTVESRPAAVEIGTATIPIRLAFATPADIPAGTPVQVDIDAEVHKGVVIVPAVAIVREGEETAVYVATDSKAKRRAVEIGLSDGTNVEILSGVKAGEIVLVDGQAGLPDDAAIAVTDGPGAATDTGRGAEPSGGEPK